MPPASFSPTAVTAPPGRPSVEPPLTPSPRKKPDRRLLRGGIVVALLLAGAAVFSITDSKPTHPTIVSGRAQPKTADNGSAERWWQNKLTVTLDGSIADLGDDAEDAVKGAFGTWLGNDDKLPKLRFDSQKRKPLVLTPDGENRVYYAPITVPGHEKDLAITLAYTRTDTGEVTEADIVINSNHDFAVLEPPTTESNENKSGKSGDGDDESKHGKKGDNRQSASALSTTGVMAPSCSGVYDVQSVMTHEIGHFFGLGEDLTDSAATMFYSTVPCDLGKRDLAVTDSTEMSTLYAVPSTESAAGDSTGSSPKAASCSVTRLTSNTATGSGVAFAAALVLFARRRRKS